jgi:UDP-glucose 4-epimerase
MRVLVTGGAGFIGSHLCDVLVTRGDEVSILDNLSTGANHNIRHLVGQIKINQGDIRDPKLVESLIADTDLVLHMAASLGVDNILENPIESISTNFYGSEIILNMAAKYDKRIIIASTSEIYGKNPKQPLSELSDRVIGAPQKLRWTYSDAKALEEASAYFLYVTKNLRVTTLRFFNTVGPRQSGKYGMVIPRFVQSALRNEPIKIFGDGKNTRVFCHVHDSVRAVLLVAAKEETVGEVYNVGGGSEISILDLAKLVVKEFKSTSEIEFIPNQNRFHVEYEDIERRVPDITKITSLTGWKPSLSLNQILRDVGSNLSKEI